MPETTVQTAAHRAVDLLTNPQLRQEVTEHNWSLAREHYALDTLQERLSGLIGD